MATTEQAAPERGRGAAAGNVLVVVGKGVGRVVGTLYQSGREAIELVIRNILPFMAFIAVIIGLIRYPFFNRTTGEDGTVEGDGIGDILAQFISPLADNIWGLLAISVFCAIPILSPVLGPGAVIAQVVGVLLGERIGAGDIPPQLALPALFAINPQVGCDFIPVGLALGEAEPETVEVGVPAVLFSRLITGPLAVVIAWVASVGMYTTAD
jgi:PTS system glucitol/sorbitol-specific IIC component